MDPNGISLSLILLRPNDGSTKSGYFQTCGYSYFADGYLVATCATNSGSTGTSALSLNNCLGNAVSV